MESTVEVKQEIILRINRKEAEWLRNMCQNAVTGQAESVEDEQIRCAYFIELDRPEWSVR